MTDLEREFAVRKHPELRRIYRETRLPWQSLRLWVIENTKTIDEILEDTEA